MEDVSLSSAVWEAIKIFLTSSLVVLGWMVVSDQQEARELAKSRYTRLYAIRDELRKIESSAIEYHTTKFDLAKARSLTKSIKTISDELAYLRECGCIAFSTSQDVFDLRRSITLNNCDSESSYVAQDLDSKMIVEIEAAVASIDRQILKAAQSVATTPRTLKESISATWKRRI
ncbi:hypothetical protein [Stenotrophomonas maltophilia]|jgi:hypothetical protein|uniref:hypothetical protein n=1 Tax=Stenotrophomonas maltophilia TaxID=40324 RepID=UPI0011B507A5|nr:hypothetical protein [Stenotrophomonas maltophilia]EKT4070875.1 hypothetical protein [Stenotrophomonas maltophilia]EKT4079665.1 hypothetical protein [Stenotrophomonas maltophilia]MBH1621259.1 hypothetical protein [Stenotrophomonas maltophilia]WNV15930.1 hypothetical protein RS400_05090 [Stenotrophomonas maltophilia]HDS1226017.1 hypothetical protein [Stenotrophomonas maltophilia]